MRTFTRVSAVVGAGAVLGTLGVTGVSAAGAVRQAHLQPASAPLVAVADARAGSGAQLWVRRYNGPPGLEDDVAMQVAVSPGGGRVFVTGYSRGVGLDYATAAYRADTGVRLWLRRYGGIATDDDIARALAVSPGGTRVYVTGMSVGTGTGVDYVTIAYDAATGARLWLSRYNGPYFEGNGWDSATALAVSPDGARVYVTGMSNSKEGARDYGTVAYNATTGAQLWAAYWSGSSGDHNYPTAVAVSPDGKRVYVTGGAGESSSSSGDYGTVAYDAVTGAQIWARQYNDPQNLRDNASALALSPDGRSVYVTGTSFGADEDYATIAYSAASGARLWIRRYNGPAGSADSATSLAVSPAGTVLVTGRSYAGDHSNLDYATIAYSPAGAQLWARRYDDPRNGDDSASSVTAPGNGKVYVTGSSWGGATSRADYATIAYNVFTGARLWISRNNGPGNGDDEATSVAARGGRVFVTGGSAGIGSGLDYATVAYRG